MAGRLDQPPDAAEYAWATASFIRRNEPVIILGIILILVGYLLPVPSIIATLGWIVLVIGLVLLVLGQTGRPVGGRRYWY